MIMDTEWVFYIGVGLFALIGALQTGKIILERIAAKKGPENTKADEWASYLGLGTNALKAIAAALGVEVKSDDSKEVVAAKVKAGVDAKKG